MLLSYYNMILSIEMNTIVQSIKILVIMFIEHRIDHHRNPLITQSIMSHNPIHRMTTTTTSRRPDRRGDYSPLGKMASLDVILSALSTAKVSTKETPL